MSNSHILIITLLFLACSYIVIGFLTEQLFFFFFCLLLCDISCCTVNVSCCKFIPRFPCLLAFSTFRQRAEDDVVKKFTFVVLFGLFCSMD